MTIKGVGTLLIQDSHFLKLKSNQHKFLRFISSTYDDATYACNNLKMIFVIVIDGDKCKVIFFLLSQDVRVRQSSKENEGATYVSASSLSSSQINLN